jgi:hypothetical protein
MTYLAMRRGAYILPKFIGGVPLDQLAPSWANRLPFQLTRPLLMRQVKAVQGDVDSYGLPRPDHKLGQAHPTVSADLLDRIGHGRIAVKPNLTRIDGSEVQFADGSSETIDTIVWCTGYRITFPFLDPALLGTAGNQVSLYRRVVHPERTGLYFIGLVQPLGAIMPIAERQAEWIADLLEGSAALPPPDRMRRAIEREDRALRKRYVASTRHTIQVDFHSYMRTLARERKRRRGVKRALPAANRAPLAATAA